MISGKIAEICVTGAAITGYCAREYEIIGPDQFQSILTVCTVVIAVLFWKHFFSIQKR
jgi:nitrogen regulatory protein PII-like uncharacterized protein